MPPQLLELNEDLLDLAEIERGNSRCLLRLKPSLCTPPAPHTIDPRAIAQFEQQYESAPDLIEEPPADLSIDPTPLELDCLKALPENLRIADIASRLGVSYWFIANGLKQLERIGLVTRRTNRRHWPTERGFALIGVAPVPAPAHPCKAGQAIYFGKNPPALPKPKTQLPQNITIFQTNEGFFIDINGTTLDVPFDSSELARRGAEAFLATKPIKKKGIADYFKRKRQALFQFIGEA